MSNYTTSEKMFYSLCYEFMYIYKMDLIVFGFHKGILVQTTKTEERFFMVQYGRTEPITGIDAELEAARRVCDIQSAHREAGIEKSHRTYHYLKGAIMEKIEKGITVVDSHRFKHAGEEIKINLN